MTAQLIYSGVMVFMAVTALLLARRIHDHPELCVHPMPQGAFRATVVRSCGVMAIAGLAVVTSYCAPRMSNVVFILMATLRPIGNRTE